jgi:hypothetical protein
MSATTESWVGVNFQKVLEREIVQVGESDSQERNYIEDGGIAKAEGKGGDGHPLTVGFEKGGGKRRE